MSTSNVIERKKRRKRTYKAKAKSSLKSLKGWASGPYETECLDLWKAKFAEARAKGSAYAVEVANHTVADFLQKFGWRLADHEIPVGPFPKYDPHAGVPVELFLTEDETKARAERIVELEKRIVRWLKYRTQKRAKPVLAEDKQNPMFLMLCQMTGVKWPGRARQTHLQLMHEHYDEKVKPLVESRWEALKDAGQRTGKPDMAFRAGVAKDVLKSMTDAEQKGYSARAKASSDAEKAEWDRLMKSEPSTKPEDRLECMKNAPNVVGEVLEHVLKYAGYHGVVFLGGMNPEKGGEVKTVRVCHAFAKDGKQWNEKQPELLSEFSTQFKKFLESETFTDQDKAAAAISTVPALPPVPNAPYTIDAKLLDEDDEDEDDGGSDSSESSSDDDTEKPSAKKRRTVEDGDLHGYSPIDPKNPDGPLVPLPANANYAQNRVFNIATNKRLLASIGIENAAELIAGDSASKAKERPKAKPKAKRVESVQDPVRRSARNKENPPQVEKDSSPKPVSSQSKGTPAPLSTNVAVVNNGGVDVDVVAGSVGTTAGKTSALSTGDQEEHTNNQIAGDTDMSNGTRAISPPSGSSFPIVPDDAAEWFLKAFGLLTRQDLGPIYARVIADWVALEMAYRFQTGPSMCIPIKDRPIPLHRWIRDGRTRNPNETYPPPIGNVQEFVLVFKTWYDTMMPEFSKRGERVIDPIAFADGLVEEDDMDKLEAIAKLQQPGANGMLSVVACLQWWGDAVKGGDSATKAEWEDMAKDVSWVLQMLGKIEELVPSEEY